MNTGKGRVDDAQIINTFEDQIKQNGSTTTLDVKKALRAEGYEVYQDEVSDVIANYVENGTDEYDFSANGRYRTYCRAIMRNFQSSTPSYVGKPKAVQKTGDWDVTDGIESDTYTNMTRNQARYRFSQEYDVPYVKTSATVAQ